MALDMQRHLEEFEDQGFTIVPGIAGPEMRKRLISGVEESLQEDARRYLGMPGKEEFISLDLVQYGGVFWDLLESDIVDEVFSTLLNPYWTVYSFTSTVQRPAGEHYTSKIHNETRRITPSGYNLSALLTLALDEFTEENGATYYLPGSHLTHPEKPDEDEFYAKAVRVTRGAGDAVLFHPRVWHAGGQNMTEETRYGCSVYACLPFMKQRLDFPRMLGWERAGELSPRLRRILGYDSRVPAGMDQFYVPADQRLYLGGQE
jgi:ectoine hydroxylase-related dioxygenase (phytanoyl-CoA dioxygenase family)